MHILRELNVEVPAAEGGIQMEYCYGWLCSLSVEQ